jgi:hypothetical protein
MITISYVGNMGNQMFQYAFGRSIAEDTGMKLVAPAIPGFANTGPLPGKEILEPLRVFRGCRVDRWLCKDAKIHLRGSFEYYPMLEAYRNQIKTDWLYRPKAPRTEICMEYKNGKFEPTDSYIHPADILLNIRLGDFLAPKHKDKRYLGFPFFRKILDKLKFRRLFIASDEIQHEELRGFDVYNPVFMFSPDKFATLNLRYYFNRLIISRSTYTWWLGYLSDIPEVYLPVPNTGVWSIPWRKQAQHDLWVNEDRYIYYHEQKDNFLSYKQLKEVE